MLRNARRERRAERARVNAALIARRSEVEAAARAALPGAAATAGAAPAAKTLLSAEELAAVPLPHASDRPIVLPQVRAGPLAGQVAMGPALRLLLLLKLQTLDGRSHASHMVHTSQYLKSRRHLPARPCNPAICRFCLASRRLQT